MPVDLRGDAEGELVDVELGVVQDAQEVRIRLQTYADRRANVGILGR